MYIIGVYIYCLSEKEIDVQKTVEISSVVIKV